MRSLSIHLGHMIPGPAIERRMEISAGLGFREVEFPFPYATPAKEYAALLAHHGLRQNVLIAPAANYLNREPGYAIHPQLRSTFRASIPTALEYADTIGAHMVHVMSGCTSEGQDPEEAWDTFLENIAWAAKQAAAAGRKVVLEHINSKDFPGYYLTSATRAREVCDAAGPNVGIIHDVYHATVMGEDPVQFCRTSIRYIDHLQVADAPGRHEPGTAGIRFGDLFQVLADVGYQGTLGLEYKCSMPLEASVAAALACIGTDLARLGVAAPTAA